MNWNWCRGQCARKGISKYRQKRPDYNENKCCNTLITVYMFIIIQNHSKTQTFSHDGLELLDAVRYYNTNKSAWCGKPLKRHSNEKLRAFPQSTSQMAARRRAGHWHWRKQLAWGSRAWFEAWAFSRFGSFRWSNGQPLWHIMTIYNHQSSVANEKLWYMRCNHHQKAKVQHSSTIPRTAAFECFLKARKEQWNTMG